MSVFCQNCDEPYNPKRAELGYKTCLDCGSPPVKVIMVEVNKSNPSITLDPKYLLSDAYKNCTISSNLTTNNYVQLGSYK